MMMIVLSVLMLIVFLNQCFFSCIYLNDRETDINTNNILSLMFLTFFTCMLDTVLLFMKTLVNYTQTQHQYKKLTYYKLSTLCHIY